MKQPEQPSASVIMDAGQHQWPWPEQGCIIILMTTADIFQTLDLPSLGTHRVWSHLILKITDKDILITSHLPGWLKLRINNLPAVTHLVKCSKQNWDLALLTPQPVFLTPIPFPSINLDHLLDWGTLKCFGSAFHSSSFRASQMVDITSATSDCVFS